MLVRVLWLRWLVGGNGDGIRNLPLSSRSDIFAITQRWASTSYTRIMDVTSVDSAYLTAVNISYES